MGGIEKIEPEMASGHQGSICRGQYRKVFLPAIEIAETGKKREDQVVPAGVSQETARVVDAHPHPRRLQRVADPLREVRGEQFEEDLVELDVVDALHICASHLLNDWHFLFFS